MVANKLGWYKCGLYFSGNKLKKVVHLVWNTWSVSGLYYKHFNLQTNIVIIHY